MNKLEGTGALLLLTAVLSWFLLGGAAYCTRHALLLCVLLSQMAEEVVCSTHSVLIMMMSCFSWKITIEKEKKRLRLSVPKISIYHLKNSKRSQSLTVSFQLHTSDWEVECATSLCSDPADQTSDSTALPLSRHTLLTVLLWMRSPHSPCSVSLPINTFKIDL